MSDTAGSYLISLPLPMLPWFCQRQGFLGARSWLRHCLQADDRNAMREINNNENKYLPINETSDKACIGQDSRLAITNNMIKLVYLSSRVS